MNEISELIVILKKIIQDFENNYSERVNLDYSGLLKADTYKNWLKLALAAEGKITELLAEIKDLQAELNSHHEEMQQVCGYRKLQDAKQTIADLAHELSVLKQENKE